VKLNTAALGEPLLVTAAGPVDVVPIATVAAEPGEPVGPGVPAGPVLPVGPVGPVGPVAPCGTTKLNVAAEGEPTFVTAAGPVDVVPTAIVAAFPAGPVGPGFPVSPVGPGPPVGPVTPGLPVGPAGP
jgi:hypothetical protein